tara:strand:+ start:558 stop:746 length:189 start_codon:yes stop_codon:yes gene_type:complete
MFRLLGCRQLIQPGYEKNVYDQIKQGQGKELGPSQVHDLIVAKAWNRPSNPDKEEDKAQGLS